MILCGVIFTGMSRDMAKQALMMIAWRHIWLQALQLRPRPHAVFLHCRSLRVFEQRRRPVHRVAGAAELLPQGAVTLFAANNVPGGFEGRKAHFLLSPIKL